MQNQIKISIPIPCHEDWNKMTPNEQGSFCGKCCKTVVDFSNKTIEEIKNTLLAKKHEKLCGRFTNDQLNKQRVKSIRLKIPYYLLPKNISYQKAFGIALFFVFGTGLFSCVTPDDHTVGEISIDDTLTTKTIHVTNTDNNNILGGVDKVCEEEMMQGQVTLIENDTMKKDTLKRKTIGKISISK